MDYKDKIVLITGASRGIGRETAFFFASLGCHLIITYNKSQILSNNVLNDIKNKYNVTIYNYKCDLSNVHSINGLYLFVKEKYGHVDILVNNASLSIDSDISQKTKKEFMKVLEVNTVGTFFMIKYFAPITDYIFNISSTDALDTGSCYNLDYSCSKATINCMTEYLSLYYQNVKIYALCPNWVDTEAIREMDSDYLKGELQRVKQDKLINPRTIPLVIKKCIDNNQVSGSIIRIDGDVYE